MEGVFVILLTASHDGAADRTVKTILTLKIVAASGGGGTAPAITTQPQSLTVTNSGNATFSLLATGTAPLSYQWTKDSTNIPGATNSSWSLANARTTDAGIYSVVVTNSAGSITSSNAQLTVTIPSAPALSSLARQGNNFVFTFTPVVGLTNSVLTNGTVGGIGWSVLTNIPPPVTATSISVTDVVSGRLKIYRVSVSP